MYLLLRVPLPSPSPLYPFPPLHTTRPIVRAVGGSFTIYMPRVLSSFSFLSLFPDTESHHQITVYERSPLKFPFSPLPPKDKRKGSESPGGLEYKWFRSGRCSLRSACVRVGRKRLRKSKEKEVDNNLEDELGVRGRGWRERSKGRRKNRKKRWEGDRDVVENGRSLERTRMDW